MHKFNCFCWDIITVYIVNNFGIKLDLILSLHLFPSAQRRNYIFPRDLTTSTLVSNGSKVENK